MTREDELVKAGWERRFISCEPRLSEIVEMYKELGLEVHLEPLPEKKDMNSQGCTESSCTACFDGSRERYRIIYTKPADNAQY